MIQELLKSHKLDAYLTFTSDEHLNEYIGDSDKRLEFLTGFSGSNGMAVTCAESVLYTDSRYYIQATNQSKEYKLKKMEVDGGIEEHLSKIHKNGKVGICTKLIGSRKYESLRKKFEDKGLELKPVDTDFVDMVWKDRPKRRFNRIYSIENEKLNKYQIELTKMSEKDGSCDATERKPAEDIRIVGKTYVEKLEEIRHILKPKQTFVITELDTIAWIFNLRGSDVLYNPIFYSYAIIAKDSAKLFVNGQVDIEGIEIYPYDDFRKHVPGLGTSIVVSGECNAYVRGLFSEVEYSEEIRILQSQKTDAEIEGFRLAYAFDGVALTQLFEWIDLNLENGVSEEEVESKLNEIKKGFRGYKQPSFGSIVGGGANGAIVHHKAGDKVLRRDELLLIDSGSQYVFGTTDTTRTLHFGEPSEEQKTNFTRVLKGQLRAMRSRYRSPVQGSVLDALARLDLWKEKLDFGHATGHGVGHSLCVHEAPPCISSQPGLVNTGQVFSIEPGFYKECEYGIRIENLVYLKDIGNRFCDVINLTSVPYQLKLINASMLDDEEVAYLNMINGETRSVLEPLLRGSLGHKFLLENTKNIEK